MTDALRPISVETLLRERAWVEALARRLVADDATAADVVQQTWLAAIESPPREATSLRGWLSRVVRNAAFESRRRAVRRERRETAAPAREPEPSPAETVAKAEAHRLVVDAVMSLDEPYRTAVLLRFFEGIESDEVARRTGVPVETARTRIKRALAMLRARLDTEHGGDGKSWALAIAPLVSMKKGMPVGAAVGGAIMGTKAVVAGTLVGVLVGALVTASVMKTAAPPRDVATATSAATPGAESPTASATPPRESERTAPSPAPTDASAPAAKSALAAAFDAVEIEPPKFVAGAITGFVRTKDGAGVAGVTIKATSRASGVPTGTASGQAAETPAESALRSAITAEKWRAATQRETTTDAAGAFRVTGLAEGRYWLGATAKGWAVHEARGSGAHDVGPGSSVEYVATAVVEVPVIVLTADGTTPSVPVLLRWEAPVSGGSGSGGAGGGNNSAPWTAAKPVVALEAGTWRLRAELGKGVRSPTVTVTAALGSNVDTVALRLGEPTGIEGVVRFDPPESAWASIDVRATRRGEQSGRAPRPVRASSPGWKFVFDDLEPGVYDLSASPTRRSDDPAVATAVVEVMSGRVTQDLVVPRPDASKSITVRVTGPDGAPLTEPDVHFGLRATSPAGGSAFGGSGIPMADGSFLVQIQPRVRGKDMDLTGSLYTDARWQLEVTSESCGKQAIDFQRGDTHRLDVRFTAVAKFIPVLDGVSGTPLEGRIRTKLGYPSGDYVLALNNEIGTSVEPGRYVVFVVLDRRGPLNDSVLARIPVELVAGENRVPLHIPEVSTLLVRVPAAAKGTEVRVEPARRPGLGMSGPTLATDDAGLATCPELVPGLYRVAAVLGGVQQEMLVRVPAAGEVTFAPTTMAGLAVTVDDDAGLLAKAGFQTGDIVTAMDGVEIDSMLRLDNCYFGSRGHATATVTVRRGGRDVMLTIDPAKFSIRADYGGTWEPVIR